MTDYYQFEEGPVLYTALQDDEQVELQPAVKQVFERTNEGSQP